jgi:two-component system, LytTR family, response regulator
MSEEQSHSQGRNKMTSRVLIKSDKKVFFVKQQDIDFIEAAGNYVHVSLGSFALLTRISLNALESLLNSDRFVRIHRSAIVNLDEIGHVEPQGGEYLLTLRGGKQLKASRKYIGQLFRSIKGQARVPLSRQATA